MWSLYLTILNAIVELGPEDGKAAFGTMEWRELVRKVREGGFWEEVVREGYRGVEGNVDADVIINLYVQPLMLLLKLAQFLLTIDTAAELYMLTDGYRATLLLAHAPNQRLNQTRLEAYLASSMTPNLDISSAFDANGNSTGRARSDSTIQRNGTGTSTPRDLNARVKILELYTLHVLLRNDEWDYARDFISASEVLDDERREAFLNALQSLEDEKEYTKQREIELQEERERELQRELEEAKRLREENEERERLRIEEARSERARSEVDYGVEASKARPKKEKKGSKNKPGPTKSSISKKTGKAVEKKQGGMIHRAGIIITNLKMMITQMSGSLKTNPLFLIRMLAFVVGLLLVMGNQRVKNRLRGMMDKVRATAGMGVKVSYI